MSYNIHLHDAAIALAFKTLKTELKKKNITQEDFELYTKLAVMYIKTRKNEDSKEFVKYTNSMSFPKLERVKKLDLFENMLFLEKKK